MLTNPVLEAIRARRSTRVFENKPVPIDMLDAILDAAVWAPNGSNRQTWRFTAVAHPETMHALNIAAREACKTYVPDDDYPPKKHLQKAAENRGYVFTTAPVLIIASNDSNYPNALADCVAALQNMFLAAQSLGLGSCYINAPHWLEGNFALRNFLLTLCIPKEHTICGSAAIGYIGKPTPAFPRNPDAIRIV